MVSAYGDMVLTGESAKRGEGVGREGLERRCAVPVAVRAASRALRRAPTCEPLE